MRGIGTLVFVLGFLVNFIVCPGYHRTAFHFRPELLDQGEYPGAHIRFVDGGPLTPVVGMLAVWMKGKFIVAWNDDGSLRPVHDEEDAITIRDRADNKTMPLTIELARMLEVVHFTTISGARM